MNIQVIDSECEAWDNFVDLHPEATAYHKFAWKKVIAKTFGHKCFYLAALDDSDWQGVLPLVHMNSRLFGNFLVSVPFVNYGGLLHKNASAAELLLQKAERIRRSLNASHVELRHVGRALQGLQTREHKVTMMLELAADQEMQWQQFNAKLRNQARKAEKSGLRWISGHLELLEDFYTVFARNMRDLGTPVYSKSFFRNVLEAFPKTTKIFVVYHKTLAIAAGIGSWFRDTLEVPWASSIGDYKSFCPNNMLYWEAIKFAIEKGLRKLDFGRSTPNEGTYNFKKQWGAVPVPLYWQYLMDECRVLPNLGPSNPKFHSAIRIWQKLPLSVTKALGPVIVKNIP